MIKIRFTGDPKEVLYSYENISTALNSFKEKIDCKLRREPNHSYKDFTDIILTIGKNSDTLIEITVDDVRAYELEKGHSSDINISLYDKYQDKNLYTMIAKDIFSFWNPGNLEVREVNECTRSSWSPDKISFNKVISLILNGDLDKKLMGYSIDCSLVSIKTSNILL